MHGVHPMKEDIQAFSRFVSCSKLLALGMLVVYVGMKKCYYRQYPPDAAAT
jgi:hypothetical protein